MRRTAMIMAGLLLGASLLGGCGGSDNGNKGGSSSAGGYCDLLKSSKKELDALNSDEVPNAKEFQRFLDRAKQLSKEAPAEVRDDWKVLSSALDDLKKALDDAGITFDQFSKAASGQMPEGLDQSKLAALGAKLQSLSSTDLENATKAIQKHAKDECNVDLEASTPTPSS